MEAKGRGGKKRGKRRANARFADVFPSRKKLEDRKEPEIKRTSVNSRAEENGVGKWTQGGGKETVSKKKLTALK